MLLLRRRVSPVIAGALISGVVVAFALLAPVSGKGVGPRLADAAAPAVEVRVDCTSNPEITAFKNNTDESFTVEKVGSMYKPRSDEPFVFDVKAELEPGVTGWVETGPKADAYVLTTKYIYNDHVGSREGARVATSVGNFAARCPEPKEKNGGSSKEKNGSSSTSPTPSAPPSPPPSPPDSQPPSVSPPP